MAFNFVYQPAFFLVKAMAGADKYTHRKEFLWGRYRALQNFREKLLFDSSSLEDRRHDIHLRTLVDCGDFEEALAYTQEMAAFCEAIEDLVAADIYRRYRDRVAEIKSTQIELEA